MAATEVAEAAVVFNEAHYGADGLNGRFEKDDAIVRQGH